MALARLRGQERPHHGPRYALVVCLCDLYDLIFGLVGVPRLIEHPVIQDWGHTYGKTFHFWQIEKTSHTIPLGIPQLMMAPCRSRSFVPWLLEFHIHFIFSVAHVNLELFQRRDKLYSIDTEAEKVSRASLNIPIATDKFADHWAHTSEVRYMSLCCQSFVFS